MHVYMCNTLQPYTYGFGFTNLSARNPRGIPKASCISYCKIYQNTITKQKIDQQMKDFHVFRNS